MFNVQLNPATKGAALLCAALAVAHSVPRILYRVQNPVEVRYLYLDIKLLQNRKVVAQYANDRLGKCRAFYKSWNIDVLAAIALKASFVAVIGGLAGRLVSNKLPNSWVNSVFARIGRIGS